MERDAKQFADWGVDYVKVADSPPVLLCCCVFIFFSFVKVAISLQSPLSIPEQQFIIPTIISTDLQLDGCYSEPSSMETGYPQFGAYLNK